MSGHSSPLQEWKNILLRGESTEDYAHYREAFNRDGAHVDHLLQGLLESSDEKQKSAINGLLTEHTQLSARYREFWMVITSVSHGQRKSISWCSV